MTAESLQVLNRSIAKQIRRRARALCQNVYGRAYERYTRAMKDSVINGELAEGMIENWEPSGEEGQV